MSATVEAMPKMLRIGELAARTGHSVHAIRWYEAQGLIPGVIRGAGGRRAYRERHLNWVELIHKLRLTGMSIAQIRQYANLVKQGRVSIKLQQQMLRDHRARVRATIERWNEALELLDQKIDYFGEWLATGRRPDKLPETEATKRITPRARQARPRLAVTKQ